MESLDFKRSPHLQGVFFSSLTFSKKRKKYQTISFRLANQAHTMETLTGEDFPDILSSSSSGVFIDFFAPWCPPCMSLLPEFRKASTLIGGQITFGTVDCTIHGRLCNQHGVRAYPTTVFFNNSRSG